MNNEINKLDMKSYDFSINNIELIEKIFPQVVFYENNVKKIDFSFCGINVLLILLLALIIDSFLPLQFN